MFGSRLDLCLSEHVLELHSPHHRHTFPPHVIAATCVRKSSLPEAELLISSAWFSPFSRRCGDSTALSTFLLPFVVLPPRALHVGGHALWNPYYVIFAHYCLLNNKCYVYITGRSSSGGLSQRVWVAPVKAEHQSSHCCGHLIPFSDPWGLL